MVGNMSMSSIESALAIVAAKVGFTKLFTLVAVFAGVFLMAIFRPPQNRKEVLKHGLVALLTSYLAGPLAAKLVASWLSAISGPISIDDVLIPVHGFIGAFSWAAWAGAATWRDKLARDPQGAIQNAKDLVQ